MARGHADQGAPRPQRRLSCASASARAVEPRKPDQAASVRPIDVGTEKTLLYRAWTERNRTYVDRVSRGRLGYVHIADTTKQLLKDLHIFPRTTEEQKKLGVNDLQRVLEVDELEEGYPEMKLEHLTGPTFGLGEYRDAIAYAMSAGRLGAVKVAFDLRGLRA